MEATFLKDSMERGRKKHLSHCHPHSRKSLGVRIAYLLMGRGRLLMGDIGAYSMRVLCTSVRMRKGGKDECTD